MYCGWRGKIGLIMPHCGTNPEHEFHQYAPEGVTVMTQRVLFERVDPKGLKEMGDRVDEAAKILSDCDPDLIMFGCTSGSFIQGIGYDQEIIKRIEDQCGVKALTTATALIMGLKALGSKRLVMATPYIDEVNQIEKRFLEDSGFEVLAMKGLQNLDPTLMPKVTLDTMYKMVREIMDPRADTIFISCTGMGMAHGINMMEKDFGCPLITSNQVSIWGALRSISIHDDVGLGKLFTL